MSASPSPQTMAAARLQRLHQLRQLRTETNRLRSAALGRYWHDPAGWARDCILWRPGEAPAPYQAETLNAVPQHRRVAGRGPHGLGKTSKLAWLILWFATTRDAAEVDWKVPTVAGSWRQLRHYLWPEIHKWARRVNWAMVGRDPFDDRRELLDLHLKLAHGEAFAAATNDPALLEGAHATSLLYVFEEAKSIPDPVWDAAEGAFASAASDQTEAYAVAWSTPGPPQGRFWQIHRKAPGYEDWHTRHVTLHEAIHAGRISPQWAEQRRRQWAGSPALIANRVEGDFAESATDTVIPLHWAELAVDRWHEWYAAGKPLPDHPRVVGVDVARGGADQTVLAYRAGWVCSHLHRPGTQDTMATADLCWQAVQSWKGRAVVDVIGVGAGVVDRLRQRRAPVEAFNASAATKRRDRSGELGFVNVRSAAWWNLRELLDPTGGEAVALPPDDLLIGDLCAPTWREVAGGRIQVEAKETVAARIGRSTDTGDAVMQAYWSGGTTWAGLGGDELARTRLV